MTPTYEQTHLLLFKTLVTSDFEQKACFIIYCDQTIALVIAPLH